MLIANDSCPGETVTQRQRILSCALQTGCSPSKHALKSAEITCKQFQLASFPLNIFLASHSARF